MKSIFLTICLLLINVTVFSQSQVAKIKFEQAEEAYSNRNYKDALTYLNEAEKILKGSNTTTLYLKIMIENAIVQQNPMDDFILLNSLRSHCDNYLKTTDGKAGLEDKFKDVYLISENLKKYPNSKEEYEAIQQKKEEERLAQEKIAAERREIERKRKMEEDRKRAEEQKFLEEKRMRKIDYVSFFGGLVVPLSADSRSIITYNQWQTAVNETPFTTALKKGKFGLGLGVNFGFNGIIGLEALNKTKAMRAAKLGLGIIIEASQTFQFFNFDDMRGYPSNQAWYYEGDQNKPFATSSIGAGPSLSLQLGKKQTFIDLYLRADMNIFWWGKYYASVTNSDGSSAEVEGYSEGVKLSASPSLGVSFRFRSLYVGAECRFMLINKSTYVDDFYYELDYYTTQHDVYSFTPSRGINLSYFGLKLGIILSH